MSICRSLALAGLLSCVVAACGGGGADESSGNTPPASFTVGGVVSGLAGTGLTLSNGSQSLTVTGNGAFSFASPVANGSSYAVTATSQPTGPVQNCTVANGTGTVNGANVTTIAVTCSAVALALASSTPAHNATDLGRAADFVLTFSAPLSVSTVTPANVTLRSPAGNHPFSLAVAGTKLTVTPSAQLMRAMPYTVTVGTAVRGTAGEEVLTPISVRATTSDGTWSASTLVSSSNAFAFWPRAHGDASGGALVTWTEDLGIHDLRLMASHSTDGTTWDTPTTLGTIPFAISDDIAIDSAGNAIVVWPEGIAPPQDIVANRYTGGMGWGTAAPVETFAGPVAHPTIAMDANDDAMLVWQQSSQLVSRRFVAGTGWAIEEPVTPADFVNLASRSLGVDGSGNFMLVWGSGLAGQTVLHYGRYVPGTGWEAASQIPTIGSGAPVNARMVMDDAGRAIVVWGQHDGTRQNLWTSRFTPGQGWSTAQPLEASAANAVLHALDMARDGSAIAVWTELEGTRHDVWANRFLPEESAWQGAELLEVSDLDATSVGAVAERGGNAHVVWDQGDIVRNRFTRGGGWMGALATTFGMEPSLASSPSGEVFLAVTRNTHTGRTVWVRQFQ